jgi:hypothetical protein
VYIEELRSESRGLGFFVEWPEDEADAETKRDHWVWRTAEALGYRVSSGSRIPLKGRPQKTGKIT